MTGPTALPKRTARQTGSPVAVVPRPSQGHRKPTGGSPIDGRRRPADILQCATATANATGRPTRFAWTVTIPVIGRGHWFPGSAGTPTSSNSALGHGQAAGCLNPRHPGVKTSTTSALAVAVVAADGWEDRSGCAGSRDLPRPARGDRALCGTAQDLEQPCCLFGCIAGPFRRHWAHRLHLAGHPLSPPRRSRTGDRPSTGRRDQCRPRSAAFSGFFTRTRLAFVLHQHFRARWAFIAAMICCPPMSTLHRPFRLPGSCCVSGLPALILRCAKAGMGTDSYRIFDCCLRRRRRPRGLRTG